MLLMFCFSASSLLIIVFRNLEESLLLTVDLIPVVLAGVKQLQFDQEKKKNHYLQVIFDYPCGTFGSLQ